MIEDLNDLARLLDGYIRDLLSKNAQDLINNGSRDSKNLRVLDLSTDVYATTDRDYPGNVYINVLKQRTSAASKDGYWYVGGWPVSRATEAGLVRMQRCLAEFVDAACVAHRTGQPFNWFDHHYLLRRPNEH